MAKSHIERKEFSCFVLPGNSPSSREARVGAQGRNLVARRPLRSAAYWIVPYGLLSWLSYSTQDSLPRGSTVHYKLDFSTSIVVQGNAPQTWPQPDLIEATNSSVEAPFPRQGYVVSCWQTNQNMELYSYEREYLVDEVAFYTKAINTIIAFNGLIERDTHYNWTWK